MELSLLESSAPQEVTDLVARETRNTSVSHMRTAFHETLKPNMGHVTKLIQNKRNIETQTKPSVSRLGLLRFTRVSPVFGMGYPYGGMFPAGIPMEVFQNSYRLYPQSIVTAVANFVIRKDDEGKN